MNFIFAIPGRAVASGCALLAALAVAGCGGNPTGDFLASAGLGPKTAARPDFVARTRPEKLDYIPIGSGDSGRPTAAKTPDEVKAAEAELDAVRTQNQSKGEAAAQLGGTPAPQPVSTPAPAKKTKTP